MKSKRGFTLVEIMTAIAIVSILTGAITVKVLDVGRKSRDVDRQGDVRMLQSAIELYKNKYGIYPAACKGADTWSGQVGTTYACASGNQYIVGLAPEFIPALPKDPKAGASNPNAGYVYRVNAAGTAYKILAYKTVESEAVTENHALKPCDITSSNIGICDTTSTSLAPWFGSTPPECQDARFTTSYGAWGGFPNEPFAAIPARSEEQAESTICRMP